MEGVISHRRRASRGCRMTTLFTGTLVLDQEYFHGLLKRREIQLGCVCRQLGEDDTNAAVVIMMQRIAAVIMLMNVFCFCGRVSGQAGVGVAAAADFRVGCRVIRRRRRRDEITMSGVRMQDRSEKR